MIVIGIDPGAKGGIAVIRNNGTAMARPYDTATYLSVIHNCKVESLGDIVACVEEVHAMPRQGVSSMFSFGKNFGFILGMLYAEGIETVLVDPRKWKKAYKLSKNKEESIALAKKFYPEVTMYATPRCTTEHDGMAEALLIARYLRSIRDSKYPIDNP